jgi:two-component system, NtrC family, response regulator
MIKVLIVEDDFKLRSSLSRTLEVQGFTVYQADNSPHAFDEIKKHKIDALVIDIDIARANDFEFSMKLRDLHPDFKMIGLAGDHYPIEFGNLRDNAMLIDSNSLFSGFIQKVSASALIASKIKGVLEK